MNDNDEKNFRLAWNLVETPAMADLLHNLAREILYGDDRLTDDDLSE